MSIPEIRAAVAESGFEELPMNGIHAETLAELPWRHKDPFDRILVAQSLAEPLRLITVDTQVARYSDTVILI